MKEIRPSRVQGRTDTFSIPKAKRHDQIKVLARMMRNKNIYRTLHIYLVEIQGNFQHSSYKHFGLVTLVGDAIFNENGSSTLSANHLFHLTHFNCT